MRCRDVAERSEALGHCRVPAASPKPPHENQPSNAPIARSAAPALTNRAPGRNAPESGAAARPCSRPSPAACRDSSGCLTTEKSPHSRPGLASRARRSRGTAARQCTPGARARNFLRRPPVYARAAQIECVRSERKKAPRSARPSSINARSGRAERGAHSRAQRRSSRRADARPPNAAKPPTRCNRLVGCSAWGASSILQAPSRAGLAGLGSGARRPAAASTLCVLHHLRTNDPRVRVGLRADPRAIRGVLDT